MEQRENTSFSRHIQNSYNFSKSRGKNVMSFSTHSKFCVISKMPELKLCWGYLPGTILFPHSGPLRVLCRLSHPSYPMRKLQWSSNCLKAPQLGGGRCYLETSCNQFHHLSHFWLLRAAFQNCSLIRCHGKAVVYFNMPISYIVLYLVSVLNILEWIDL